MKIFLKKAHTKNCRKSVPYAANDEKKKLIEEKKEAYFTAGHINGSIKRFRDISKQDRELYIYT